jgi:uncharacterized protein (TIGR03083 family)
MAHDYSTLLLDQLNELAELADSFDEAQWDTPSLCEGWKVRDVISHMTIGGNVPLPKAAVQLALNKFDLDGLSFRMSKEWGASHSGKELAKEFRRIRITHPRRFVVGDIFSKSDRLVDHMTHENDMRIPLGLPRAQSYPRERMVAALDRLPHITNYGPKKRAASLRLEATDYDWSFGSGPLVRGAATDLILGLGGRQQVLDRLDGDGVSILKTRH